ADAAAPAASRRAPHPGAASGRAVREPHPAAAPSLTDSQRPPRIVSGQSKRGTRILALTPRRRITSMPDDPHLHDRGLAFDLSTLLERRRALKLLGGVGLATLVGCGSSG